MFHVHTRYNPTSVPVDQNPCVDTPKQPLSQIAVWLAFKVYSVLPLDAQQMVSGTCCVVRGMSVLLALRIKDRQISFLSLRGGVDETSWGAAVTLGKRTEACL